MGCTFVVLVLVINMRRHCNVIVTPLFNVASQNSEELLGFFLIKKINAEPTAAYPCRLDLTLETLL